jgi:cation diffusion facilitator CzcD-associated flavoprotein CzcO
MPDNHDHHAFGPGKTVAVIGAGISGVCAAAHLLKQGLLVTVFERSGIAGGVWHYDGRISEDPPYPNDMPSTGDYQISQPGEFTYATPPPEYHDDVSEGVDKENSRAVADLEVHFAPPGPCYAGLKNNVPTHLMTSALGSWPEGTEPFVSQRYLEEYVQTLAKNHGVDDVTSFHTRVDEVRKTADGTKWELRLVSLEKGDTGPQLSERTSHFDLVVVASGHYNMPRIPETEGLMEWKSRYPSRIIHSKQYRSPETYRGQNVLVVGAGVSAMDICRELDGVAANTYQSVRGGMFDLPISMLPASVVRVAEVAKFEAHNASTGNGQIETKAEIPGFVVLKDGRVLENIHHVLLATGYITSYPFLSSLHSDDAPITAAGEDLLVTSDGTMAHNLHRDIFYINDPTLAFVGVPYYVATFSLFDFQAQAIARVFADKARLPGREEMRREYERRVEEKGLGRGFHSLHGVGLEVAYVQQLVDWVNRYGAEIGEPPMLAHSEEWKQGYDELKAKTTALFKSRKDKEGLGTD